MEELELVSPSLEYENQILHYRKEMSDTKSSFDGCSDLQKYEDISQWLDYLKKMSKQSTCPKGFVEGSQFLLVRISDNKVVGMLNVRHYLNEFLKNFGGNIGYSILPSERRKGYGKEQLRLAIQYCKSIGMREIAITCLDTNTASRKIIQANGGMYDTTIQFGDMKVERYWIIL